VVPAAQTPCLPVEQATLPPGLLLSTTPLQSSSIPLHISAVGCTSWLQTIAPPVHAVVPSEQAPSLPVLQASPPPGLPLSTTPLQSLSSPSHASAVGLALRLQTTAPAVHAVVPAAQTPSCPVEHATPPPGLPLSTTPSQSSSTPLHVSATAAWFAVQAMDPPVHAVVPAEHAPCWPVEHARPPPGLLSSTVPLQSSSRPSHVSADGAAVCTQTIAPAVHAVVPAAHAPRLPVLHAAPLPGLPLSITPSQSLSSPSHVSACAALGEHVWAWPLAHAGTVLLHWPTPHEITPSPSSASPLQSSSTPLHVSALGSTWPTHAPHAPPAHVCMPAWHAPMPAVPAAPA
jgi:hypothetical protein